jgi:glycosyltransferase involved in cell wall biosynthesis
MVSIIIPTKNARKGVTRLLSSLHENIRWIHEVIVVDSYSSDGTAAISKSLGARVIMSRAGRSEARNIGATAARGEYVLFLDSDMEVKSDIVERCIQAVRKKGAEAVIVPEITVGNSLTSRARMVERYSYRNGSIHATPCFLKRRMFIDLGGFDTRLVAGEDYDLDSRLRMAKIKVVEIEDKLIHHEDELNFPKYMMKSFFYGTYLKEFIGKRPAESIERFSPLRWREFSASIRELKTRYVAPKVIAVYLPYFKLIQAVFTVFGILYVKATAVLIRSTSSSDKLKLLNGAEILD